MQKIDFFPIPVLSQLGGPSSKTEASLSKGFQAFISLKGGSRAAKTTWQWQLLVGGLLFVSSALHWMFICI